MQHRDTSQPGEPEAPTSPDQVEREARLLAVQWRARGAAESLDAPLRPPPSSALLGPRLAAVLHQPLDLAPPNTIVGRVVRALGRWMGTDLEARVRRLEGFSQISTEELSKTIRRLDTELAEARARIGQLEELAASLHEQRRPAS